MIVAKWFIFDELQIVSSDTFAQCAKRLVKCKMQSKEYVVCDGSGDSDGDFV